MSNNTHEPASLDEAVERYAEAHAHEHDDAAKPSAPANDLAQHIFDTMLAQSRAIAAQLRKQP